MASTEEQRARWRADSKKFYHKDIQRSRARRRANYLRNKAYFTKWGIARNTATSGFLRSLKTGPCSDCKKTYDPVCMDFDHRPGVLKLADVGTIYRVTASKEAVMLEIAKCDLVCSNCHRLREDARRKEKTRSKMDQLTSEAKMRLT